MPRTREIQLTDLLEAILRTTTDGFLIVESIRDDNDVVIDFLCLESTKRAAELLGMPGRDLVGERLRSLNPKFDEAGLFDQLALLAGTEGRVEDELQWHAGASLRAVGISALRAGRDVVIALSDLTPLRAAEREVRELEERLRFAQFHDALTGLPNRRQFRERLAQAALDADRRDAGVAIFSVNLDGWNALAMAHGEEAGDSLIQESARRLYQCLRTVDTAARLGEDDFACVVNVEKVDREGQVHKVAERILAAFRRPMKVAGQAASLYASIGVSLYPSQDRSLVEVWRRSIEALFRAKRAGKNRYILSA